MDKHLFRTLLLGTERTGGLDASMQDWLQQHEINTTQSVEQALLEGLATESLTYKAAKLVPAFTGTLPTESLNETLVLCSKRSAHQLTYLLRQDHRHAILMEYLEALSKAGRRVPAAQIPVLLFKYSSSRTMHTLLKQVCGERGAWLIQNDADLAKHYAVKPLNEWETGSAGERVNLLMHLRKTNPSLAIQYIESTYNKDTANERTDFIQTLAQGLSMADEAFLEEKALNDRSKEVTKVAANLLAQLPQSAYSKRMEARLKNYMIVTSGLLSGKKLEIKLPEEFTPDMERDRINAQSKFGIIKVGEKANWLGLMVSNINPSFWNAHFKMDNTSQIIKLVMKSDYAPLLFNAFIYAAQLHRNQDWIDALCKYYVQNTSEFQKFQTVIHSSFELLDNKSFNECAIKMITDSPAKQLAQNQDLIQLLSVKNQVWTEQLTMAFIKHLQEHIAQHDNSYNLKSLLVHVAQTAPYHLASKIDLSIPNTHNNYRAWFLAVEEFQATLKLRKEIWEAAFGND